MGAAARSFSRSIVWMTSQSFMRTASCSPQKAFQKHKGSVRSSSARFSSQCRAAILRQAFREVAGTSLAMSAISGETRTSSCRRISSQGPFSTAMASPALGKGGSAAASFRSSASSERSKTAPARRNN